MAAERIFVLPTPRLRPYLALARPANVATAAADILAGLAVVGALVEPRLIAAGVLLYAGGVALNDAFDAPLDARERPERPIPAGRVSRAHAFCFGAALLAFGIAAAFAAGVVSGTLALVIAAGCVLYDAAAKHRGWAAPVTMGTCRGLNLLLGMSAAPALLWDLSWLALLPFLHVAGVTVASRGEAWGGTRAALLGAFGLTAMSLFGVTLVAGHSLSALLFVALFAVLALPPLFRAIAKPEVPRVRGAVKAGVLALIALDAALAAAFAGPATGLAVLALLPASILLARSFSVT